MKETDQDKSSWRLEKGAFPCPDSGEYRVPERGEANDQAGENQTAGSEHGDRLIADHATDMIWTIELDGPIPALGNLGDLERRELARNALARQPFTYVSPASRRLLGFDPQVMRGKTVRSLLTPDSFLFACNVFVEEMSAQAEAGAESNRERTEDFQHIRADGSVSWCEVKASFLRDERGAIRGMLGVTRDISSRKAAEDALRDSAETVLNLFTHLPDSVLVVDRDARIRFVNRDAPGVPAEKLVGSVAFDYVLAKYRGRCQQALERAFTLREVQQIQVRSRYHEWLDCRIVPMRLEDQPDSAMIICTDFTQQRRAERLIRLQLQLSAQLSETSDLDSALDACLDAILMISETDCGGIYLVRPSNEIELRGHRGLSDEFVVAASHYDADTDQARVVMSGLPLYIREGEFPTGAQSVCENEGMRCLACVPVCHEGRPIACINVASRSLGEIPPAVRGGLEATAALIGSSIARIQADRCWRESESRMRSLVENMPDVVLITDLEGHIRYINHMHPALEENEVLGTTGLQFFSADQHEAILAAYRRTLQTREVQPYECVDNFGRRWSCRAVPMMNDQQVHNLMVINTDITERKLGEQALQQSEERLRLIAENVTDIVWTAEFEGIPDLADVLADKSMAFDVDALLERWRFTFISPSIKYILGYSVEEGLQLRPRQFLTPVSYAELRERFAAGLAALPADTTESDRRRTLEMQHVARDGRRCWCEITSTFFRNEQGNVVGVEGVTRDISERKRFERELSEIITQQQQQTGRELHDGLGQQLVGARLIARGLQHALADQAQPIADQAAELVTALSDAETRVRELILGVRPVEVAANGLMAALADLASSTQRLSGIPCVFACDQPVAIDDNHTATQLYYIAREAAHNATKHASAENISIDLVGGEEHWQLRVADDGQGMPAQAGDGKGMGLRIMRHRAGVIGAALVIDTTAGGGTRITCTLPLEQIP